MEVVQRKRSLGVKLCWKGLLKQGKAATFPFGVGFVSGYCLSCHKLVKVAAKL